jgi:hypothetical protein
MIVPAVHPVCWCVHQCTRGIQKGAVRPQWCGTGGSSERLAVYRLSPFGLQASANPCEIVPWPGSAQACANGMPSIHSSAIYRCKPLLIQKCLKPLLKVAGAARTVHAACSQAAGGCRLSVLCTSLPSKERQRAIMVCTNPLQSMCSLMPMGLCHAIPRSSMHLMKWCDQRCCRASAGSEVSRAMQTFSSSASLSQSSPALASARFQSCAAMRSQNMVMG